MFGLKAKQLPVASRVTSDEEAEKSKRVQQFSAELQLLCEKYGVELTIAQVISVTAK